MRLWLYSSARSASLTPSVAISVVTHVVLVGGAIYGTGRASRAVEQQIAERVYFLPPPDRAPSSRPVAEHVRYQAAGGGVPLQADARSAGAPGGVRGPGTRSAAEQRKADDARRAAPATPPAAADSLFSILNVDQGAVRVAESAAPVYPPALIKANVEGSVATRFVIDSTGRIDTGTVEILASTDPAFTQSVRDAMVEMRFNPAMVAGRRVRQMVEQRFDFRITAPVPAAVAEHTRVTPAP